MTPALAGKIALVLLGVIASWFDIATRKLPNWLSLVTLVAGLIVSWLSYGPAALGSHLLHMVVALAVGMTLFRFGIVGGGDAKFYAAVAAWFSLSGAVSLLLAVTLSGLVIFLVWFVSRRLRKIPVRAPQADTGDDKLPYGIAIAAGAIIAYSLIA